jgi:hypothetical protein
MTESRAAIFALPILQHLELNRTPAPIAPAHPLWGSPLKGTRLFLKRGSPISQLPPLAREEIFGFFEKSTSSLS